MKYLYLVLPFIYAIFLFFYFIILKSELNPYWMMDTEAAILLIMLITTTFSLVGFLKNIKSETFIKFYIAVLFLVIISTIIIFLNSKEGLLITNMDGQIEIINLR